MREVLREEQVQQYNKAVEACAELLEAFASACPYNQDRIARGLPVRIPLGPDDVEQWALKATGSAGGVQLRFQAFSASQVRLVPGGLDPLQHWQFGQAVTSPLDQEVTIPDDCNFASCCIAQKPHPVGWEEFKCGPLRNTSRQVEANSMMQ